jgi:DNA-binding XRE family transcriptional regulator
MKPLVTIKIMTGADLKDWRKKWGITQDGLSKALGVCRVTVNRWERGLRSIPVLLPLALEALENRLKKGGPDESMRNKSFTSPIQNKTEKEAE